MTSVTGVVAAMAAEARFLGRSRAGSPPGVSSSVRTLADGTLVNISGIGLDAALVGAAALIRGGASALVSWGMAGALDPRLQAGAIVVPNRVLSTDGASYPTSAGWRQRLLAALSSAHSIEEGDLLTSMTMVDSVARKAELYQTWRAVAVDMESSAVAKVAADRGVPFIAVRVIVDTAADSLPPAVMTAGEGAGQILKLLAEVAVRPSQIAALIKLARRYAAAKRSLLDIAGSLRSTRPQPA